MHVRGDVGASCMRPCSGRCQHSFRASPNARDAARPSLLQQRSVTLRRDIRVEELRVRARWHPRMPLRQVPRQGPQPAAEPQWRSQPVGKVHLHRDAMASPLQRVHRILVPVEKRHATAIGKAYILSAEPGCKCPDIQANEPGTLQQAGWRVREQAPERQPHADHAMGPLVHALVGGRACAFS